MNPSKSERLTFKHCELAIVDGSECKRLSRGLRPKVKRMIARRSRRLAKRIDEVLATYEDSMAEFEHYLAEDLGDAKEIEMWRRSSNDVARFLSARSETFRAAMVEFIRCAVSKARPCSNSCEASKVHAEPGGNWLP